MDTGTVQRCGARLQSDRACSPQCTGVRLDSPTLQAPSPSLTASSNGKEPQTFSCRKVLCLHCGTHTLTHSHTYLLARIHSHKHLLALIHSFCSHSFTLIFTLLLIHIHKLTCSLIYLLTDIHLLTPIHTKSFTHLLTLIQSHNTSAHTHTLAYTPTHTHSFTNVFSRILILTCSRLYTNITIHTPAHTHSYTQTYSPALTRTLT